MKQWLKRGVVLYAKPFRGSKIQWSMSLTQQDRNDWRIVFIWVRIVVEHTVPTIYRKASEAASSISSYT